MSGPESLNHPADVLRLALRYPLRWLIPAAAVAAAVCFYASVKSDVWEASQQLVVRNEAARNHDGPGKFRHSDELKALLETILELSRSHAVLHAAMTTVDGREPTELAVSEMVDAIKLSPPKGGEFGKSEVFYLKVKDKDRRRAIALCTAICDQLEARFRELRNARALSMVAELDKTVALAKADVIETTQQLQELEQAVGADLSELRNLQMATVGADSDLRRKALEMEGELRKAIIEERRRHEWLNVLTAAQHNPEQLLSLPGAFTETLPTLSKLKDGLLAAQMQTAQLLGTMTRDHPRVRAALDSEREIARHFEQEAASAIRAADLDWRLAAERVDDLKTQIPPMRARLDRLASLRSEYSRRFSEVENRTRLMNDAQREQVDARAALASAEVASLITRVDQPLTGPTPQGPGRTTLMAAGVLGGLTVGIGVLLLTVTGSGATAPSTTNTVKRGRSAPAEPTEPIPGVSILSALRKAAAL